MRDNKKVESLMRATRKVILTITLREIEECSQIIDKQHAAGKAVTQKSMYLNAFVLFRDKLIKIGEFKPAKKPKQRQGRE